MVENLRIAECRESRKMDRIKVRSRLGRAMIPATSRKTTIGHGFAKKPLNYSPHTIIIETEVPNRSLNQTV